MYDGDESEGPKGTFEIYKAEADTLFKQGEYRKSIESYTTALELQPGDKNCLVSRSKCYLQLGDTDNALTDAESSLQDDKNFHKGVYQKAQALYYQGDFELSLVYYHRGHKLRPELQEFRLGIQKAQEAIDNSVGSPDKVQLTTEGDLSFFEKQDDKKPKKRQGYGSYGRGAGPAQSKALDTRRPEGNEKTIKQLLGELYGDRQYLEKLLKETDQQTDMGKSISSLVSQGLSYLDTRTDFWRQQKPMYTRKHDRAQQRRKTEMVGGKLSANDYIIKELERIDQAQIEGKYQESLKRAQRCLGTVQTFSEDAVPNKMEVIANLYSCIGNAHLELGNYDKSLENHQIDYDMGEQYDMEEACSRGLDNLGRVHARKGDYSQAIEVWEKKLPLSKSALESTWLYHEVGRCYLEMEQYQKAKDYGEKSLIAAEEAEDTQWQLQASVLVAQSEVKLGDLSAALSSFETSLDLAKTLGDTSAETAIKKAIDDVNTKIAKGGGSSTSINKESASTKEKEEANVDDSNNAESSDITEEEEEKGEGTVKPYPNFNAKNDAEVIKNAMSGLGTEEEDITNVLAFRTLSQRQEIAAAYKSEYGKDMLDEIEGETSGDYAETIKGLLMSPREFDAHQLRSAMKGAGTDEDILFEIICTRSNAELKEIKKIYKQNYKAELVDHIVSETSKDTKHLLVSLANCNRSDSREVDNNLAKKDAKALHDAAHKSRGTDEATITTLLVSRSFPQLRATFNEYKKLSGKDIEDMLEYELSGDLLTGTKTVVNCVRNKRSHFAKQLQKVTKGIGTDDKTLIRVIVSRCEKDLVQVKDEYKKVSGTTLESTIESETSGSYKDMLTKLVSQGQPPDMSAKKKD